MIIILATIMTLLVACGGPKEATPIAKTLTKDELSYFNDELFSKADNFNLNIQFMTSLYEKPEDIDLFQLFYSGSGIIEKITEDEMKEFMVKKGITGSIEEIPAPFLKVSRINMEDLLIKHIGLKIKETNQIGLDEFVYLSQYDAYYDIHGDSNYRGHIKFTSGEQKGDIVRLFYEDDFYSDGDKVLTLKEKDGNYLFVANQQIK